MGPFQGPTWSKKIAALRLTGSQAIFIGVVRQGRQLDSGHVADKCAAGRS